MNQGPAGIALVLSASLLHAQAPAANKSLEDELQALLNTPITVASQKAMTTRESPGIVSLVTREEILASGARDLLDVLRLVPGFDFGSDVQGVVGPFVRGLWAFEGKLLLLVDGQELNETRYGTTQFGSHIPVDQIKQVEIIRGPGSAIYGGFAELAVVNVITRQGRDLRGLSGGVTWAEGSHGNTQRTVNATYGDAKDDFEWSLAASAGRALRAEESWTSFSGARELKDLSRLNQGLFNLGIKYKDFQARVLHDRYEITDWTFFRDYSPTPMRFQGTYAEVRQAFRFSDTFQLVPKLTYKSQLPWFYPEDTDRRKKETRRTTLGVQAQWDPNAAFNLLAGLDSWKDEGRTTSNALWSNGDTVISYTNYAAYLQGLWSTAVGNVTLGARYDHNSQFGSSFVPRFAFTKVWGSTHMKLLASKAFRAPAIENFELNKSVRPEKTTALELEVGTQLSSQVFLSGNVFDLSIKDPMVYFYDSDTGFETYQNYPRTGSRGLELDLMIRGDWGFSRNTLTVFRAKDNQVPDYQVPGEKAYFMGAPIVKATFLATFKIASGFTLTPSVVALGKRHAFETSGGPVVKPATALVNLSVHWKSSYCPALITLGVQNLTGAQVGFIKAYQGTDGDTYPSRGTEAFARVAYNF